MLGYYGLVKIFILLASFLFITIILKPIPVWASALPYNEYVTLDKSNRILKVHQKYLDLIDQQVNPNLKKILHRILHLMAMNPLHTGHKSTLVQRNHKGCSSKETCYYSIQFPNDPLENVPAYPIPRENYSFDCSGFIWRLFRDTNLPFSSEWSWFFNISSMDPMSTEKLNDNASTFWSEFFQSHTDQSQFLSFLLFHSESDQESIWSAIYEGMKDKKLVLPYPLIYINREAAYYLHAFYLNFQISKKFNNPMTNSLQPIVSKLKQFHQKTYKVKSGRVATFFPRTGDLLGWYDAANKKKTVSRHVVMVIDPQNCIYVDMSTDTVKKNKMDIPLNLSFRKMKQTDSSGTVNCHNGAWTRLGGTSISSHPIDFHIKNVKLIIGNIDDPGALILPEASQILHRDT